jgi:hypothetical protein
VNYKLRQLGIGLAAMLALGGVNTSISPAAQFTASNYPAVYEGVGNPSGYGSVTTEAGSIECKSGTASATLSGASSTLSVKGTAGSCSAFGFMSATVTDNGCTTLVHVKEGSGDIYTGTADLVCPEGKSVVTVMSTCEMQVPPQIGKVTLQLTNNTGAEGTVSVSQTSATFRYIVTKDGFGCPFNGTGERTNGTVAQTETAIVHIQGQNLLID